MQTFILMTKLSPEVAKQMKDRAKLGRAWLDQVKQKCPEVKFVAHYALSNEFAALDFTAPMKNQRTGSSPRIFMGQDLESVE